MKNEKNTFPYYGLSSAIQAIFKQHKKCIAYQKESETGGWIIQKAIDSRIAKKDK